MTLAIVILGVVAYYSNIHYSDKSGDAAINLLDYVQEEIIVATKVKDGYVRGFELPQTMGGKPYTITIDSGELSIEHNGKEYSSIAPIVSGDFNDPSVDISNVLRKVDGVVYLNS
ncbi:hypothetical protein GOV05_04740 [Candidatus Woesearchaeota archaeon]|nr:hypothetical protein [Candidatus Woesearchaeota archaeon]